MGRNCREVFKAPLEIILGCEQSVYFFLPFAFCLFSLIAFFSANEKYPPPDTAFDPLYPHSFYPLPRETSRKINSIELTLLDSS